MVQYNPALPPVCYIFIFGAEPGKRIGLIKQLERGYYLTDFDSLTDSDKIAELAVKHFNEKLRVTPAQSTAMEIGSMFGWHVPGANPDSYAAHST